MGDFPIQAIVFPVLAIAFAIFYLFYRRRSLAQHDTQYANYRAGELAQRMGLTLVSGDPAFNLFIQQAHVDVQRGPSDKKPIHIEVRMTGAPHGPPLELYFLYRVEQETNFNTVTWRTWTECRVTATAKQPFPPFEVMSKSAPLGPIAAIQALPPTPTGNPQVDATHTVCTREPAMAQLLGQVIPEYVAFERGSGIHLVGDGKTVSFKMQRDKAPILANALYYAESMGALISGLAVKVGG